MLADLFGIPQHILWSSILDKDNCSCLNPRLYLCFCFSQTDLVSFYFWHFSLICLKQKARYTFIISKFKILAYCGPDWLILKYLHPDWFNWNTTRIFHYRLMSIEDSRYVQICGYAPVNQFYVIIMRDMKW